MVDFFSPGLGFWEGEGEGGVEGKGRGWGGGGAPGVFLEKFQTLQDPSQYCLCASLRWLIMLC